MGEFEGITAQYGGYLDELRKRIYRIVIVFAAAFFLGLFSTNHLIRLFVSLLKLPDVAIVATSPFQLLDLAMSVGLFTAIIVTIPFFVQQAYVFLRGALLPGERTIFFLLIPLSILLFLVGFSYGFAILYYALDVIAQLNVSFGVLNLWDISRFISQIMLTSALLGLLFQFPLVLTLLVRLGVLSVGYLRARRKHAYIAILVFVALLPPTDGLSFLVMSLPLVGMYELMIVLNSFQKHRVRL